ncbi:Cupredoxin [Pterulicium gracile]|uniref:Cupredoxin n=1 Tax=Pterulicium gracile TaxID=1884261 RepID=A0A5C3QIF6_9AGAR|nr:Cupredoxin [Pterula gracilis]
MISISFALHMTRTSDAQAVNTLTPLRRDIAMVGSHTGTKLRFRTNKPGPWFFHCHIFWHVHAGLATVMLANPDGVRQQVNPPKA